MTEEDHPHLATFYNTRKKNSTRVRVRLYRISENNFRCVRRQEGSSEEQVATTDRFVDACRAARDMTEPDKVIEIPDPDRKDRTRIVTKEEFTQMGLATLVPVAELSDPENEGANTALETLKVHITVNAEMEFNRIWDEQNPNPKRRERSTYPLHGEVVT